MWTWTFRSGIGLLVGLVLGSCGEPKRTPEPSRAVETAIFEAKDEPDALCEGSVRAELGVRISVQIWAPASLPLERVVRHTRSLATSLRHLGIDFVPVGGVRPIREEAVFVGAGAQGVAALAEAEEARGPLTQQAKEAIIAPLVTAPLRRLLTSLSPANRREVQLIVVERIATPDSPVSVGLRHPAGLTLSPWAPATEEGESLAALIGTPLQDLAAPVVFLSMQELSKMPPELRESTLAHELGHAFGLAHGGGRENLMSPQRHARCRPGLLDEQVAILRANLGADPP